MNIISILITIQGGILYMNDLKGAAIIGQSGGPTSVINASAAGVFIEALKQKNITRVYGAAHGIRGILNEEFYDINQEAIIKRASVDEFDGLVVALDVPFIQTDNPTLDSICAPELPEDEEDD
jgi:hypothetical protein